MWPSEVEEAEEPQEDVAVEVEVLVVGVVVHGVVLGDEAGTGGEEVVVHGVVLAVDEVATAVDVADVVLAAADEAEAQVGVQEEAVGVSEARDSDLSVHKSTYFATDILLPLCPLQPSEQIVLHW